MAHRPAKTRAVGRPMRRNTRTSCLLETMNTFATPSPGLVFPPPRAARHIDRSPSEKSIAPRRISEGEFPAGPEAALFLSRPLPPLPPPRTFLYRRNFILARSSPNFGNREFAERTHGVLLISIKLPASFFTDFHEFSSRLDSTFSNSPWFSTPDLTQRLPSFRTSLNSVPILPLNSNSLNSRKSSPK